jgi:hypothetical protein
VNYFAEIVVVGATAHYRMASQSLGSHFGAHQSRPSMLAGASMGWFFMITGGQNVIVDSRKICFRIRSRNSVGIGIMRDHLPKVAGIKPCAKAPAAWRYSPQSVASHRA